MEFDDYTGDIAEILGIPRRILERTMCFDGGGGANENPGYGSPQGQGLDRILRVAGALAGGDYPILRRDQLPSQPSRGGVYLPFSDFIDKLQNARELGVAPPQAPTPEDILKWKVQTSPWAEGEILNKSDPERLFKVRGKTVGI